MAVATYMPEALKQHNGDHLSAISGYSRAVTLANLLGPLVMQFSSMLKILLGGICAFRIQHVNYQNIWELRCSWLLRSE